MLSLVKYILHTFKIDNSIKMIRPKGPCDMITMCTSSNRCSNESIKN